MIVKCIHSQTKNCRLLITSNFSSAQNNLIFIGITLGTKLDNLTEWMVDMNFERNKTTSYLMFFSLVDLEFHVVRRFIDASLYVDFKLVEMMVKAGMWLDSCDMNGVTILTQALVNNLIETVRFLLQKGVNVNKQEKDGKTVFHLAVKYKDTDLIRLLLDKIWWDSSWLRN